MTGFAFERRGPVENNGIPLDQLCRSVTLRTGDVGVTAGQREWRPFVVVKRRRHPPLRGMAIGARGFARPVLELAPVRLLVAGFTLLRRPFELNLMFPRQRLVALPASQRAVRTQQGELRLRMVKTVYVRPRSRVMAGLASEDRAVGPAFRHPLAELSVMRVLVACRATGVRKVEGQNLVGARGKPRFVAFVARHRRMRSRQRKLCLLVHCNRVQRTVIVLHRVAVFATVVVRRTRELAVMCVFVAIRAMSEFDFVNGVLARRNVALRAFHLRVLPFQGIARGLMFFHAKQRRLPRIDFVTLGAFAFHRPVRELPPVDVLVAIQALVEGKRFLEFPAGVARHAVHLRVTAQQRELCLGVIERKPGQRLLPAGGRVAVLAALLEAPTVRIHVTIAAGRKLDALEPRGASGRFRFVALFAGHLDVQARQRIAGL